MDIKKNKSIITTTLSILWSEFYIHNQLLWIMELRKSSFLIIYYPFNLDLGFNFTKFLQKIDINVIQKRLN